MTKTRYLGGWSNNRCGAYLTRCREQLEAAGAWRVDEEVPGLEKEPHAECSDVLCEHCGSDRLELIDATPKPSWSELFWREDDRCPSWYAASQRETHRRRWTECNGADFYDWYMQTQVESAKGIATKARRPNQLQLPGMTVTRPRDETYLVDSY